MDLLASISQGAVPQSMVIPPLKVLLCRNLASAGHRWRTSC